MGEHEQPIARAVEAAQEAGLTVKMIYDAVSRQAIPYREDEHGIKWTKIETVQSFIKDMTVKKEIELRWGIRRGGNRRKKVKVTE